VPIVITEGERGARVYSDGRWRHIAAFPCDSPDPTGAGDVFAAAFMVAFQEGKDVAYAAAFASAAAVLSIRASGLSSIAGREEIERLMAAHLGTATMPPSPTRRAASAERRRPSTWPPAWRTRQNVLLVDVDPRATPPPASAGALRRPHHHEVLVVPGLTDVVRRPPT
jgi:hypothetical protein